MSRLPRALAGLQGTVYVLTGLWPLVHMPSFLAVTGPKTDLWLVNTVGWVVTVIGAVLLTSAFRGSPPCRRGGGGDALCRLDVDRAAVGWT
ncbi:MAG: hypothetical protein SFV54_18290 [Bryobacteraceae bacterium]|nr:hypothetical protein [Bryobacteraceae bacterium]